MPSQRLFSREFRPRGSVWRQGSRGGCGCDVYLLPVTGQDLRAAVEALLARRLIGKTQKPSLGCSIRWKPGNEPGYFG